MRAIFAILALALVVLVLGCIQTSIPSPTQNQTNQNKTTYSVVPLEQDFLDDVPVIIPNENDSTMQEIEANYDSNLPEVNYYYSPGCSAHKEIYPLILEAEKEFAHAIKFNEYNVSNPTGFKAYDEFAVRHNVSNTTRYTPVVEIGNITLTGLWEINKTSLYSALENYIKQGG